MTQELCPNQGDGLPALDVRAVQPAPVAEALAARPLLEQVARMGDCIGANTVGQIMAISDRAAAWLRENPPGQPVVIEPRGCPIPGACACVQPAPPAEGEVAEHARWLNFEAEQALKAGRYFPAEMLTRAAELLERQQPVPVPVSERLPGPEDCIPNPRNSEGEWCWGWRQESSRSLFSGRWRMVPRGFVVEEATHWLPAHALPIPRSEND